MSRAFVKETDGSEGEELPELQISPHRNLVTATGLRQIETMVERLQAGLSEARAAEDRSAIASIQRDLRYWAERRRTAEIVTAAASTAAVRFGSTVLLERLDGVRIEYQIVGEDEADPSHGKISYVSPIARRLIGGSKGTSVELSDGEATILEIC